MIKREKKETGEKVKEKINKNDSRPLELEFPVDFLIGNIIWVGIRWI